jgi:hypothetical protein
MAQKSRSENHSNMKEQYGCKHGSEYESLLVIINMNRFDFIHKRQLVIVFARMNRPDCGNENVQPMHHIYPVNGLGNNSKGEIEDVIKSCFKDYDLWTFAYPSIDWRQIILWHSVNSNVTISFFIHETSDGLYFQEPIDSVGQKFLLEDFENEIHKYLEQVTVKEG